LKTLIYELEAMRARKLEIQRAFWRDRINALLEAAKRPIIETATRREMRARIITPHMRRRMIGEKNNHGAQ
jgi:hypothetical protein